MAFPFQLMHSGSIDPSTAPPSFVIPNGERYLYHAGDAWEIWTYHSARPQGRRWIRLARIPVAGGLTVRTYTVSEFNALGVRDPTTVYVVTPD